MYFYLLKLTYLLATKSYKDHCTRILRAAEKGESEYTRFDATPEKFNIWKRRDEEAPGKYLEWKQGTKFECLDPLNEVFIYYALVF
jgi:hypothetical protein